MKTQVETDLSKLAQIKIKMDILEAQYDKLKAKLHRELIEKQAAEYIDKENNLRLSLVNNLKRTFNIEKVKKLCEEKKIDPSAVVEEVVSAKKFDIAFKSGKSYIISEETQQECFSFISNPYLSWGEGCLDEYKQKLKDQVGDKNGKPAKEDGIEVA